MPTLTEGNMTRPMERSGQLGAIAGLDDPDTNNIISGLGGSDQSCLYAFRTKTMRLLIYSFISRAYAERTQTTNPLAQKWMMATIQSQGPSTRWSRTREQQLMTLVYKRDGMSKYTYSIFAD